MAKAKDPKIDRQFAEFLPDCGEADDHDLRESLMIEQRDPGIVWEETGILVDGHRRRRILKELKKPFRYIVKSFPDRAAVLEWMAANQLARRNLTPLQISYFRGKEYLAKVASKAAGEGRAADQLAEKHNVGTSTIQRDAAFATAVDALPNRDAVLSGEAGLSRKEVVAGLFCPRCTCVGPVKGCDACAKAAAITAKASKPDKAPKSGSVLFNWKDHETHFGHVARAPDQLGRAYASLKDSAEQKESLRLLQRLAELFSDMKRIASGG
jgi:hypothetical protein